MMKASILVVFFAAAVRAFEVTAPSCIESGSDVEISFTNTNPKVGDWIGLYQVAGNELANGVVAEPLTRNWIWTCGSQDCSGSPAVGSVKMLAPTVTGDDNWFAVLVRNGDGAPYRAKAVSKVIDVKSSCSEPTSIPLAQPVSLIDLVHSFMSSGRSISIRHIHHSHMSRLFSRH